MLRCIRLDMADVSSPSPDLAMQITALAGGSSDALRVIYSESSSRLFAICLRITGDSDAAQDVLQEVFIKLLTRADAYSPEQGSAMGWLMQIARNASIDWVRARGRQHRTRDGLAMEPEPQNERIDDILVRDQDAARAVDALNILDEQSRAHVRSAFFGGLTYVELAERDNIPLATVKSRIRRGLMRMRTAMGDD